MASDGGNCFTAGGFPSNPIPVRVYAEQMLYGVSFLWNFFVSREAATAERRYEKERWSKNYVHMAAFSTRSVYSSLSPPYPPLFFSLPPSNSITRAAGLRSHFRPPSHTPPEDYRQIVATSPKVEDGLHFGS